MLSTGILEIPEFKRKNDEQGYYYKYTEKTVKVNEPMIYNNGRVMEFTLFSPNFIKANSSD